jgi:hypothetical protein
MAGLEGSEGGGVPGEAGKAGEGDPRRWRQVVTVIRIAVAKVALDRLSNVHMVFQIVAVAAAVVTFVWWERWVGVVLLALALLAFLAYRIVSWVIERLSMPRHVRKALDDAGDEIRTELERLELPTGPVSGLRFAWRLVRGRQPRGELMGRLQEAYRTVGPIVSRALAATGTPRPDLPA